DERKEDKKPAAKGKEESKKDDQKFEFDYRDLAYARKRDEIESDLKKIEPTKLRLDMERGIAYVRQVIENDISSGRVVVHIFTDLRELDWGDTAGKKLRDEVKLLALFKRDKADLKI